MMTRLVFACVLPLTLAACGGTAASNAANVQNMIAEEGVEDLNAMVGGDELAPVPEASDDTLGNGAAIPAPPPGAIRR